MQLKDGRLLSSGKDGTLFIYNKDNYEIEISIKEHKDGISSCTQLNDERIVTCSKDHTIKIIKLTNDNKYIVESTLESHDNEVFKAIELKENEIISISSDFTMKIWDLNTFKNTRTIVNRYCDNVLKVNENEFATASMETKKVKFWNLNNYELITEIDGIFPSDCCQSMCLVEKDILLIGGVLRMYSIDVKQHQLIKEFTIQGMIWSIQKTLDGNILCSVYNLYHNNHIIKYKYDKDDLTTIYEKRKA